MRWRQGRRSTNVEDRRGAGSGRRMPGGAGLKLGGGAGIIVLLISMFLGVDLSGLLGTGGGIPQACHNWLRLLPHSLAATTKPLISSRP